jgi:hypothetical protein
MKRSPFRERRFAPAEVRRILRRALDLAERDPATTDAETPLTAHEIARFGEELGLPASAVHKAIKGHAEEGVAEDVEPPQTKKQRIVLETEIEGEIDPAEFEEIVDSIASAMGDRGRVQVLGRTLSWTPSPAMGGGQTRMLEISVRARRGKTRVRVDENLRQTYLGLYVGLGVGMGVGGAFGVGMPVGLGSHNPMLGLLLSVAIFVTSFLVAHVAYDSVRRRRSRELEALHEKVVAAVEEATEAKPTHAKKSRIVASTDEDEGDDAEAEAEQEAEAEAREERR